MENIAADEQRHIGFGVKLLPDLNREDPVSVPKAVARMLRDVTALHLAGPDAAGLGRELPDGLRRDLDEVGIEGLIR